MSCTITFVYYFALYTTIFIDHLRNFASPTASFWWREIVHYIFTILHHGEPHFGGELCTITIFVGKLGNFASRKASFWWEMVHDYECNNHGQSSEFCHHGEPHFG